MDVVQKYVDAFINGLLDGGARDVVICPGSRSTPLVVALSRQKRFRIWTLYDERSAAFFALGIGKSSLAPVALISTSGTATANFLPAIVEAKLSRVPLVVITADRPPELRDFGAPQTIDQVRIYGSHTKFFQDMPIAADLPQLFRYSHIVGARAASIARSAPAGPVHINFSFREPLLSNTAEGGSESATDHVSATKVRIYPENEDLVESLKEIMNGSRGVIVVGPENHDDLTNELSSLSQVLRWPILADPLSNLRNIEKTPSGLVRCYEILLRNKRFRESNPPEWVIQLGGAPTSKWLNSYCENSRRIILEEGGGSDWRDPSLSLSSMVYGEFKTSLSHITQALRNFKPSADWLDRWLDADSKAFKTTDLVMQRTDQPFEGKLFFHLSKILNPTSSILTVVVGNSMPVRDLDAFFLDSKKNVRLVGNKGANGIDGLVSTAMGISAVEGNVLLILGDISFYHDMNGLLAAKLHSLKATIIVVNNRGGGIFSFLSQHSLLPKESFENFFGEPHDLDFSGVKTIYGGEFYRVDSWRAFDHAFSASIDAGGLKIIEFVALDRETNLTLHASMFEEISSRVME